MKRVPEIMVTIGPTLETLEDIRRAVEAGARWFRLPCGYRQRPHVQNAQDIRRIAAETGVPLQLLLDLPSSRPRTGKMEELRLEMGDRVLFWDSENATSPAAEKGVALIPLPGLHGLLDKVRQGNRVWFCDGRLQFIADDVRSDVLYAHLDRGLIPLKTSNSLYLPDSPSPFTMITTDDRLLLEGFTAAGLLPDWIALSLVGSAEDVEDGCKEIEKLLPEKVQIMAKIETAEAWKDADSILKVADAIMVARGDLGPAVDFIHLPEAQEELVAAAHRVGKPVVVATQILEYFAESGVPQRSELSGLSLLAQQSPDVIMLGKETVFSPRPIECIKMALDVLAYETCRLHTAGRRLPRGLTALGRPPFVVAIEGANGVGKTHLCTLIAERLGIPSLRGIPACWDESPLKLRMIRDADWLASAMYFLSGVIESSRQAAQGNGKLQMMDRSLWSTLAVHYAHDPARLERLMPLVELAADRLKVPDLTIVLEASHETCNRRIALKSGQEREWDEAAGADDCFHERERQFYHWLASEGSQVVFVDAESNDPEDVYRRTVEIIRKSFPCCIS
jgi:pyruvate kinase/thymidylate kinase